MTAPAERHCTCGTPGLTYDGPRVDCDAHGLPSAAFEAGRREGAQEERDAQPVRGDLCRWCHREPQRQLGESHGEVLDEGDVACFDGNGVVLPFGYPEQEVPF